MSDETKRPIILDGKPFDWDEGAKYGANAVDADGEVNWMAAMFADPGVMTCPGCGVYLWHEGLTVRCPDCGHEWRTPNGEHSDKYSARRALGGREVSHTVPTEFFEGEWHFPQAEGPEPWALVTYTDEPSPETGHVGWCWWALGEMGDAPTYDAACAAAVAALQRRMDDRLAVL